MSKQAQAKKDQGYVDKGPTCSSCRFYKSEFAPIKWIVDMNAERVNAGFAPYYDVTLPEHQKETNLRCMIGGFAIKKMAYCNHWVDENE